MEKRIKADSYSFSSGIKGTLFLAFDFKASREGRSITVELFGAPNAESGSPILTEQVKELIVKEYLKWEDSWRSENT
jgi:hypothetical protein